VKDNADARAAASFQAIDVPGDHVSMLAEPHVATLAALLDRSIVEAEAQSATAATRP
jgi:thioesterase domain-containing protein